MIIYPAGIVTSPNYPEKYPHGLKKTETIMVEPGFVLLLEFTAFDTELHGAFCVDTLSIKDGDGTTLMEETCGGAFYGKLIVGGKVFNSTLPAKVASRSNVVNLIFTTSDIWAMRGWKITWLASKFIIPCVSFC